MPVINVNHHVRHITQQDTHYCWACALAMLKGKSSWEEALDLADLVPSTARNPSNGSLVRPDEAATRLHLRARRVHQLTPADLAPDLRRGPVALFGNYRLAGRTFDHVMVLSLMHGDSALPSTVRVGVDDPWANGSRWEGNWSDFYGRDKTLRRPDWVVSR